MMDGCPAIKLMTERTVFLGSRIGKQWGSVAGADECASRVGEGQLA
jgi:hypothetical protein